MPDTDPSKGNYNYSKLAAEIRTFDRASTGGCSCGPHTFTKIARAIDSLVAERDEYKRRAEAGREAHIEDLRQSRDYLGAALVERDVLVRKLAVATEALKFYSRDRDFGMDSHINGKEARAALEELSHE